MLWTTKTTQPPKPLSELIDIPLIDGKNLAVNPIDIILMREMERITDTGVGIVTQVYVLNYCFNSTLTIKEIRDLCK